MLDVIDLECLRGERRLFSHLSFTLRAGEILHLHGANGSGKTSLLRLLCGFSCPMHGEIVWHGKPIERIRKIFARDLLYIAHSNALNSDLTPFENLSFFARMRNPAASRRSIEVALDTLGMKSYSHLPVKALSQGQRRRVALAELALGQNPLWILDEPFTSLDSDGIGLVSDLLSAHILGGGMVILTSHQDVPISIRPPKNISLDSGWNGD